MYDVKVSPYDSLRLEIGVDRTPYCPPLQENSSGRPSAACPRKLREEKTSGSMIAKEKAPLAVQAHLFRIGEANSPAFAGSHGLRTV